MEAKHTPGPWNAKHREGGDGMYRTEIYSAQYGGIATCEWTQNNCGNGVTTTYREANANLIAHAPDLLRSLIDCEARLALLVASGRAKLLDAVAAEHARAVIAAALGHNAAVTGGESEA